MFSDYTNPASDYPNPLKVEGNLPRLVPFHGAPERQYSPMIEAIKRTTQSKIRAIAYSSCLGFVAEYEILPLKYNLLVYLVNDCDRGTQNEVLQKIHPFELAKMSNMYDKTISFEPPSSGYTSYFMNRQGDFLNRLTQQAHFFLLFEHFRTKHVYGLESALNTQRLNEFITLIQAVRNNAALPQPHFFYSFLDSKFSSLYAALIKECTGHKEEIKSKAETFIAFIATDPERKNDAFHKKFLLQLNISLKPNENNRSGIELQKI